MTKSDYLEIVQQTCDVLDSNYKEWSASYNGYATSIFKNRKLYTERQKQFRVVSPLFKYTTISDIQKSSRYTSKYDLRFLGQSIGGVKVSNDRVYLTISKEQIASNIRDFNWVNKIKSDGDIEISWHSSGAERFRSYFHQYQYSKNKTNGKEHKVESRILVELNKTDKKIKILPYIQPVKLCGAYFQLTTPLSASKHSPSYHLGGGGIDILARVKHINNQTRLAIIELKDENKSSEPQCVVMQQALIYATFVAYLLNSPQKDDWWKIFGYSKKSNNSNEPIILDVVTLMPYNEAMVKKEGPLDPISIPTYSNVILQPYTLYYKSDAEGNPCEFLGTLKDDMMK